jgi:hypothetical protein
MPAGTFDIFIEQGATFTKLITWKDSVGNPTNLTGFTARLQIRESLKAATTIISLTNTAGITLGGTLGTINILISATSTSAITASKGVYDLELQAPDGTVTRLLEGKVTIKPEVTR